MVEEGWFLPPGFQQEHLQRAVAGFDVLFCLPGTPGIDGESATRVTAAMRANPERRFSDVPRVEMVPGQPPPPLPEEGAAAAAAGGDDDDAFDRFVRAIASNAVPVVRALQEATISVRSGELDSLEQGMTNFITAAAGSGAGIFAAGAGEADADLARRAVAVAAGLQNLRGHAALMRQFDVISSGVVGGVNAPRTRAPPNRRAVEAERARLRAAASAGGGASSSPLPLQFFTVDWGQQEEGQERLSAAVLDRRLVGSALLLGIRLQEATPFRRRAELVHLLLNGSVRMHAEIRRVHLDRLGLRLERVPAFLMGAGGGRR